MNPEREATRFGQPPSQEKKKFVLNIICKDYTQSRSQNTKSEVDISYGETRNEL